MSPSASTAPGIRTALSARRVVNSFPRYSGNCDCQSSCRCHACRTLHSGSLAYRLFANGGVPRKGRHLSVSASAVSSQASVGTCKTKPTNKEQLQCSQVHALHCKAMTLSLRKPVQVIGLGLFFTPGLLAVAYAFVRGKGNLRDGLSRLLTDVSQGYFQPDVGGETIPVAEGELSDLVGGEPLFKALFQW